MSTRETVKTKTVSPDAIASGVARVDRKQGKDPKDRQEEAAVTHARNRAEIATISESNRDLRVNRRMRRDYAKAVFLYLVVYSGFAAAILLLSGWKIGGFELPQAALTVVVGSTAVSAIGLVGIVVTGLFRSESRRPK